MKFCTTIVSAGLYSARLVTQLATSVVSSLHLTITLYSFLSDHCRVSKYITEFHKHKEICVGSMTHLTTTITLFTLGAAEDN